MKTKNLLCEVNASGRGMKRDERAGPLCSIMSVHYFSLQTECCLLRSRTWTWTQPHLWQTGDLWPTWLWDPWQEASMPSGSCQREECKQRTCTQMCRKKRPDGRLVTGKASQQQLRNLHGVIEWQKWAAKRPQNMGSCWEYLELN